MSTTYSVVCEDCKEAYWAAQSSQDGPVCFYNPETVCKFMERHKRHSLKFVMDMVEPYDEYEEFRL